MLASDLITRSFDGNSARLRDCAVRVGPVTAIVFCLFLLPATPARGEQPVDFRHEILPILSGSCLECHGPDEETREAGLRLDQRESATSELESGAYAIVPDQPDASELIRRVSSDDEDERMPPEGDPLTAEQIAKLTAWVAGGASYEEHWAYRALSDAPPPSVANESWVRNPIDRFVLARLESEDVEPSPEADRYILIKRLHYDLLGLPPEPAEVDRFLNDASPDAYEQLVDRLLASPHFGERWGRHWLDKARYADSDGYEKDNPRPDAWRYRDWVIRAINEDMPFDRFTIEQLAGDLLPDGGPLAQLATAFNRQTLTNTEGGTDQEEFRVAAVMDRIETLGTVWLGLTVGCARCHSHKYDQITQTEYYQLFAFFNNGDETKTNVPPSVYQSGKSKKELKDIRVLSERSEDRRTTHRLHRGDFLQPQEEVRADTLDCLPPLAAGSEDQPLNRLDLARWLVGGENPLVPRVAVNHLWLNLFGEGLVATVNDFGVRGEPPSHPALLDWLAGESIRRGWSRKAMIKLIATSATYRQQSRHRPELAERDPANRLLARQNRFRVEAEIVRDLALASSGLLSAKIGGPSVFPPLPEGIAELSYADNFKWATSQGEDRYRRGMYTFFKRTAPYPNLITFDCPDSNTTSVKRSRSNTPLQALQTLNNEVFHEAAQALAKRVLQAESKGDNGEDVARLTAGFRFCIVRPPQTEELAALQSVLVASRDYYASQADEAKQLVGEHRAENVSLAENAAWVATLRVVLNLDEFLTRE